MSFNEIALAVGGAAIGLGSGSVISYYFLNRTKSPPPNLVQTETSNAGDPSPEKVIAGGSDQVVSLLPSRSSRMVPSASLEKSKRELRTMLLEKELVSAALTRLYEAEASKEITKDEREILSAKYRDELKSLDDKIVKTDAFIEVGDLETLRDQLVRLVNQKMDAIDKRIEKTKKAAEPLIAQMITPPASAPQQQAPQEPTKPKVPDISDLLSPEEPKPQTSVTQNSEAQSIQSGEINSQNTAEQQTLTPQVDPKLRRRPLESDSQAEQLQKELLEALDRLEKLDVET